MARISIIILCKDESQRIGECLSSLADQSLLRTGNLIEVLVVPNGCTDNTPAVAEASRAVFSSLGNVAFRVEELKQGGKSRSWNIAVHQLSDPAADYLVFLDGDIELAHDQVLERLFETLVSHPSLEVVSGKPTKESARKSDQNILERLSLSASEATGYVNVINGSCYVAKAAPLRQVWLPNDLPGEDGFLNAVVTTEGFTAPHVVENVRQPAAPTHFYAPETLSGFFHHERRIIVGTIINRWLIEHIRGMALGRHAGSWIRQQNEQDPDWVDEIVAKRADGRIWVIPTEVFFHRLIKRPDQTHWAWIRDLPLRLLVFAATIPPVVGANRILKQKAASKTW